MAHYSLFLENSELLSIFGYSICLIHPIIGRGPAQDQDVRVVTDNLGHHGFPLGLGTVPVPAPLHVPVQQTERPARRCGARAWAAPQLLIAP